MADHTPAASAEAGRLLVAYYTGTFGRGAIWESCPDPFGLAAALEALALGDETLFDVEDELVPAVRAVRYDRILAIAAELRGEPTTTETQL